MSGFSFKFNPDNDAAGQPATEHESIELAPAEEIQHHEKDMRFDTELINFDGVQLTKGIIPGEVAAALLGQDKFAESDLVAGKYEGGFKLWECSLDLCKLLISQFGLNNNMLFGDEGDNPLKGKKVLELGCGHGLPGILAMLAGATVDFQDYNKEVLKALTIPNVHHNLTRKQSSGCKPATHFFSGDWLHAAQLLTQHGRGGYYDIILTSETIYSEDSQWKLLELIKQVLQPPHGVVYVAAKTYYFGVGGGTKSFKTLVKDDGIFDCTVVAKVEDRSSGNVREILELKFPVSIMPYFL